MVEAEIRKSEPLPFRWLTKRKQEADLLARRLESVGSPYASRIAQCCDLVDVWIFTNGYKRVKNTRACRVMGCPICEQKRRGSSLNKFRHTVFRAKKEGLKVFVLSFPMPPHLIAKTSSYMDLGVTAINRITKLKIWKAKGFLRLVEIGAIGDQMLVTYHIIVVCGGGFLSGRYYVKLSDWQALWDGYIGESCPPVTRCDRDKNKIFSEIRRAGYIDLSLVETKNLIQVFDQLLRKKLFGSGGICKQWLKEIPEKKVYPSTVKRLKAAEVTPFAFLPNPWDENESDDYLQFTEVEQV